MIAVVLREEPRERTSAALAAFFVYVADVAALNESEVPDVADLFGAAITASVAIVNLGTLQLMTALDAEQATQMIGRHIVGRKVTARDLVSALRALAAEVTP